MKRITSNLEPGHDNVVGKPVRINDHVVGTIEEYDKETGVTTMLVEDFAVKLLSDEKDIYPKK